MPSWFNRESIFMALSLIVAGSFGWGFFTVAGFPPTTVGDSWQLLLIFMIFLIIPFAKKLDFFQFFSFEAKIAEIQKEVVENTKKVSDVREDVRHMIAQQNALSASVHSMNHQAVTVNNYERPPQSQVEAAKSQVEDVPPLAPTEEDNQLVRLSDEAIFRAIFGSQESTEKAISDHNFRFADTFVNWEDVSQLIKINMSERVALLRIRVEKELRRLLKPHITDISPDGLSIRRRPMSARDLVKSAVGLHEELAGQSESFDVFFRIANAAVHADEVPSSDLDTAIYLGERLLGLLTKIQTSVSLQ